MRAKREGGQCFGERFELNANTLAVVEEIGRHMPGGFFIYKASGDEELLYVNRAAMDIYGCADLNEFQTLTGYTFKGMVYPDDYDSISSSIDEQIGTNTGNMDYVEYRIIRKDGAIRWVDDYGHYTDPKEYGGIYYVFISDITEKKERLETDMAVRQAVINALSESYHTVWLINDVETEEFSLYRGDIAGEAYEAESLRDALSAMSYSQAKEYYIDAAVAESDRERMREELDLKLIVKRLNEQHQFNENYLRKMKDGSEKYFRIEFTKVKMPGGKIAVDMVAASEPGYYDAILMDIQMPEMDGYEATRAIRAMREPAHANIPILAMTANAFKEDEEAAFEAGMQAHIAKPIDVNVMMKALASVLK